MVTENGMVENRILETDRHLPPSALVEATNYLSARLVGRTLSEARDDIMNELDSQRAQLDDLTARVVEGGLATWAGGNSGGTLIVRGQANLLEDVEGTAHLERIRLLFSALETKEMMLKVLSLADSAEACRYSSAPKIHCLTWPGARLSSVPTRTRENKWSAPSASSARRA